MEDIDKIRIIFNVKNKINKKHTKKLIIDNLIYMNVNQEMLDSIYICDKEIFSVQAVKLGYEYNIDEGNFETSGLVIHKSILLKSSLFVYEQIFSQNTCHTIQHEIGHILDSYYRKINKSVKSFVDRAYNHISQEYNAERYCRGEDTVELYLLYKQRIVKKEEKIREIMLLIDSYIIEKNMVKIEKERENLVNEIADLYKYKSFIGDKTLDNLFNKTSCPEKFEKFLEEIMCKYSNKDFNKNI